MVGVYLKDDIKLREFLTTWKANQFQDFCPVERVRDLGAQMKFPATTGRLSFVYGLVDPRDHTLRYVGLTTNTTARLKRHIEAPKNQGTREWIAELQKAGLLPQMVVLDQVGKEHRRQAEKRWISLGRSMGRLYNVRPGGEGVPQASRTKKTRKRPIPKLRGAIDQFGIYRRNLPKCG